MDKEYEICKEACKEDGCYIPKDYEFHQTRASTPMFIRAYYFLKGKQTAQIPKGFKKTKCKCGNSYLYCGVDIGYCIKCLDKMEKTK